MSKVSEEKKVLLYAGEDLVDLLVLNKLIPEMVELGLKPVIIFPKKPKLTSPHLSNPAVQEYGFYQHDIIQDTIVPYLNSKGVVLDNEGKLKKDTCYTAEQLAEHYNLELIKENNVNSKRHISKVKKDNSIIGALSVRCMQYFEKDIRDAIKSKGFFWNAHPGGLPDYRGVIPVFRAMLDGARNLLWTVHTVSKGFDTGLKHVTTSQKVDSEKSVFWHYNTNADNVAGMILGLVQDVLSGKQPPKYEQDRNKGNYYSYPSVELTDKFNEKGGALVEPRHKMEMFLSQIFVPRLNPHREEFKHIVSQAIDEAFGPKNSNGFKLGAPVSKVTKAKSSKPSDSSGPTSKVA